MPKRIGIYAGTFNPVHAGHIAFALQAVQAAQLDELYFLPERQPRHKPGTEHFGHRIGMLERATKPYDYFKTLELPDINFSVSRTLPRLQKLFPRDQLVFLMGSDVAPSIPAWDHAERLLQVAELVIGVRSSGTSTPDLQELISHWPATPKAITVFESFASDISSGAIRESLLKRQPTKGLLASVLRYSDKHWLYVSVGKIDKA
jgi:nicotinate-nucleotide adenylyltransferase